MVQLSHPYMTTGKTTALTIQTFVGKVTAQLFNVLSRLVIAFLPRSKHLLISWLQSLSTVILEAKKTKSVTASTFSPSICHEVMGLVDMILIFINVEFQARFFAFLFHPHQEALHTYTQYNGFQLRGTELVSFLAYISLCSQAHTYCDNFRCLLFILGTFHQLLCL